MDGDGLVRVLDAPAAKKHLDDLAAILVDAVEGGASVNFMLPFGRSEALAFWRPIPAQVAAGDIVLLGAFLDGALVGTVQLHPTPKPNQPHRADIAKMLVLRSARRQGLAKALLRRVEEEALARGRTLLTLDTITDSPAEKLYASLGYVRAGVIPGFALMPEGGKPAPTSVLYKQLA